MFKKPNNSGWILCPSKSYPGKFYYFNVLNGEAAWSLNENEKKILKKEVIIQKVKENHLYPEPITPPDHPRHRSFNYHSTNKTCLPTFGQAIFPKYISNNKEDIPVIWTPIQMLQLVTNSKKMLNRNTQREQDDINVHTCTIPLSKRFGNKINEGFAAINYVAAAPPRDWCNSPNIWSNIHKQSDTTDMQYKRKSITKPVLKESKLKKLQCTNKKGVWNKHAKQDSTQLLCNKDENLNAMPNKMLTNLDINDLRYVLKAKRRKSVEKQDLYKVNKEHSTFNNRKKVTFNIRDNITSEKEYVGEETTYRNSQNLQTSAMYLVVDLDVLLEDYDFIKRYIDKDENSHLYIPSVIQNELKALCMGEHGGRSRVIVARQLLRQLGSITPRLNLPENKEFTKMYQIINCCLEITKLSYDVVLITKDIEIIETAKLYKIQAYHINEIKSNDLENINFDTYKYKQNLFLQNTCDFDPFTISKTIRSTDSYCSLNISGTNKESLIKDVFDVNENNFDISDINRNFSKLNINDKILNIKRTFKNNVYENIIVKSNNRNNNFKVYHNYSINRTVGNSDELIMTRMSDKKENINITFNTNKALSKKYSENNLEHYANVNLITKPLNGVFKNQNASNKIFEDMLKKFHIKNNIMEHNLYVRFDEWVCFYEQIIEDFLSIILQKNRQKVNQLPPWFLHEGMECLKDIYRDNNYITNIIDKLLHYYDFSSENGTNIKPYNFMKLFGCGFYLVEALEKTSPIYISDIKNKLLYLRDSLECPVEDFLVDSPVGHRDAHGEDTHTTRYNFVKDPSVVLDYLKKHFSEWKNYNEAYENRNQIEQEVNKDNIKVLRTFGKDLNKLTINKSKFISFTKETDTQTYKHDFQSNDYPKVIRNIKLLDKFEEKIKRNEKGLDFTEVAETISSIRLYRNDNKAILNDRVAEPNDIEIVSVNNDSQNNDLSINDNNDSTKDSGFGSNSLHAYSLVRNFLSELSSSFKIIHTFIDESIKDYSEDITEENKKNLYEKANKTHTHIAEIIDKLKIIIERESREGSTLKSLLIKAGTDDKRTTRYRAVVMKCLEQATVLENSLKLMLSITNDEVLSVTTNENIHFINIYE